MTEAEVVTHLTAWLKNEGWVVRTEVNYLDVLATRGDEVLRIEAKGHTSSKGLDIDTMFGQLLRHIDTTQPQIRYGVAVPADYASAVQRIDHRVLARLTIDVFLVDVDGRVRAA